MGAETFHHLKKVLKSKGLNTSVGDEGGFAPNLRSNEEAMEVIMQAIEAAGYRPGEDIFIALDSAASEFYENGVYELKAEAKPKKSALEMIEFYSAWADRYPMISIEDGMAEGDWDRLEGAHRKTRSKSPTGRRRYFRDQHENTVKRHIGGNRQFRPDKAQPDRHHYRDHAGDKHGPPGGLYDSNFTPFGRDRRYHDRRPCRCRRKRPDKDRVALQVRPACKIQSTASDRRGTGQLRMLRGPVGISAGSEPIWGARTAPLRGSLLGEMFAWACRRSPATKKVTSGISNACV